MYNSYKRAIIEKNSVSEHHPSKIDLKRITSLLTVVIMTLVFLMTGCGGRTHTELKETEINEIINTEYNSIYKKFKKKAYYDETVDYLVKWAAVNKIKISDRTEDYIVFSLPVTENYENAQDVILQLPIGYYDLIKQNQMLAAALSMIKALKNHGKVKMIFTRADNGIFTGAEKLDAKYLDTDNFINLTWASKPTVYNRGSSIVRFNISKKTKKTDSKYTAAYKLEISGLSGGSLRDISAAKPHVCPIMTLAKFLTTQKAKGFIFDIAEFNGGSSTDTFASEASAVIVIPDSAKEKMTAKYDSALENFDKKYKESEPNYSYTLTEVDVPHKVLTESTSDSMVNLLYTINTGININDKGEVTSATSVEKISTKGDSFRLSVFTEDIDKTSQMDTASEVKTSCGLYGFKCKAENDYDPWITDEKNYLVTELSKKANSEISGTLTQTENVIFKTRQPKLNAISYGANSNCGANNVVALIKFIKSLNVIH